MNRRAFLLTSAAAVVAPVVPGAASGALGAGQMGWPYMPVSAEMLRNAMLIDWIYSDCRNAVYWSTSAYDPTLTVGQRLDWRDPPIELAHSPRP